MANKNIKRRRKSKDKFNNFLTNLGIGILGIILLAFIISSIDRFFFNPNIEIEYPNLSTLITQTNYEKQTGHKIEVEILNGCGVPNLARMYTDYLRNEGLDIVDSKNADNFKYSKTKILHHRGELKRAQELANILMLDNNMIITEKKESIFYDLTLIIGSDYISLESYKEAVLFQPPF